MLFYNLPLIIPNLSEVCLSEFLLLFLLVLAYVSFFLSLFR